MNKLALTARVERSIVRAMIAHLARKGWTPRSVWDLDTVRPVATADEMLRVVFESSDDSRLYFDGPTRGSWVFLVRGNGEDVISDCGGSIAEALDDFYVDSVLDAVLA